jgi:hypothetical protein
MKQYLYGVLQTDIGRKDLSESFRYKLSSFSRDSLLKTLNPEHKMDQIKKETINDARAKAEKAAEMELETFIRRQLLLEQLKNAK